MLPENVKIELFSKEYIDGECIQSKGSFDGKCYLKNQKIYIKYKEWIEGIDEPLDTLMTFDENYIQISRSGEIQSCMKFVCREDTVCRYLTGAGTMDLVIHTMRYAVIVGEMTMDIHLDYSLEMNGVEGGHHKILIKLS